MPIHTKDGWQQSGTLTTGDRLKIVSMQANFATAGFYTIQFGIQPPPQSAPFFGVFDTTADIEWSVEGATVRRTVSVGNGVSVSGPGQAAKVTIRDVTVPLVPTDYTVAVQITPGTRPSVERPPTLRGIPAALNAAAGGGGFTLQIPPDAGVISVETSYGSLFSPPSIVNPILVNHLNTAGTTKAYYADVETTFVPVNPSTTAVTVKNFDPLVDFLVQLTWGIDG